MCSLFCEHVGGGRKNDDEILQACERARLVEDRDWAEIRTLFEARPSLGWMPWKDEHGECGGNATSREIDAGTLTLAQLRDLVQGDSAVSRGCDSYTPTGKGKGFVGCENPEQFLSEGDFAEAFGGKVTRSEFLTCWPWRRTLLRAEAGLLRGQDRRWQPRNPARDDLSRAMLIAPGCSPGANVCVGVGGNLPCAGGTLRASQCAHCAAWYDYCGRYTHGRETAAYQCWACENARGKKQSQCGVCFQEAPLQVGSMAENLDASAGCGESKARR